MSEYRVIGVMSGTSLDGLDLAFCRLWPDKKGWGYEILKAETIPYDACWADQLRGLPASSGLDIVRAHIKYGRYISVSINHFIKKHQLRPDLIASHGHTIFHHPAKGITFQLGEGAEIAARTGITTISGFRNGDVALGGQGAPLVPVGDALLFDNFSACINLGGFSNISFNEHGRRVAYDICPVNLPLNHLANMLGRPYDPDGKLAANGKTLPDVLVRLNSLEYYQKPSPKSLGREWYEKYFLPLLNTDKYNVHDLLRTVTEHIAEMVSRACRFETGDQVLITGGGAKNNFLASTIRQKTEANIIIPDPLLVDYKEALAFALLGVLRFRNEINCFSSVTGASRDSSAGIIHQV